MCYSWRSTAYNCDSRGEQYRNGITTAWQGDDYHSRRVDWHGADGAILPDKMGIGIATAVRVGVKFERHNFEKRTGSSG